MKMNAKSIQNTTIFIIWVLLNVFLFLTVEVMETWLIINQVYINLLFFYVLTQTLNLSRSKKPIVQIKYPLFAANVLYLIALFVAALLFVSVFDQTSTTREHLVRFSLLHGIPLVVYLTASALLNLDNIKTVKHLRKTQQDIRYMTTVSNALQALHEDFAGDVVVKQQLFTLYESVKYAQITTSPEVQAVEIQLVKAVDMLSEALDQNDDEARDVLIAECGKIIKKRERTLKGV